MTITPLTFDRRALLAGRPRLSFCHGGDEPQSLSQFGAIINTDLLSITQIRHFVVDWSPGGTGRIGALDESEHSQNRAGG